MTYSAEDGASFAMEREINEIICAVEARRMNAPTATKRIIGLIRHAILRAKS